MRTILFVLMSILVLAGCSGKAQQKQAKKPLTGHELDSAISKSGLPGAGTVGKALSIADSAKVRAEELNKLAK
jgi:uncharacterized protein YceK